MNDRARYLKTAPPQMTTTDMARYLGLRPSTVRMIGTRCRRETGVDLRVGGIGRSVLWDTRRMLRYLSERPGRGNWPREGDQQVYKAIQRMLRM